MSVGPLVLQCGANGLIHLIYGCIWVAEAMGRDVFNQGNGRLNSGSSWLPMYIVAVVVDLAEVIYVLITTRGKKRSELDGEHHLYLLHHCLGDVLVFALVLNYFHAPGLNRMTLQWSVLVTLGVVIHLFLEFHRFLTTVTAARGEPGASGDKSTLSTTRSTAARIVRYVEKL